MADHQDWSIVVNESYSKWRLVKSRAFQVSILEPDLFSMFISGLDGKVKYIFTKFWTTDG